MTKEKWGLLAGPLAFIIIMYWIEIEGLDSKAQAVLASSAWIAIWWITEAISIAATALLPLILFPLTGAMSIKAASSPYGHPFVFLYLGGFIIAIGIEKYHLHKRIAMMIIKFIGSNVKMIIMGFMIATAFLSMWISNTATAVMLLPVGMAIVLQLKDDPSTPENETQMFGQALMLAIAYSASIGGMATLIGTPPNLVLAGVVKETLGETITFSQWFIFGFPLVVILLSITWYYLTHIAYKFNDDIFKEGHKEMEQQLKKLGKMTSDEKKVAWIFFITACAWIFKSVLLEKYIPFIDDTIIALLGGLMMFVFHNKNKEPLLHWRDTQKLPWGIIILFGGGLSLAEGFEISGLAQWIGQQFTLLEGVSLFVLVLLIVFFVNFLTEITSNLATTAMLLPVLASIAISIDVIPYYLLVGATLAASCAFMLPVATPPNAVVFGSGYLKISDMVKVGFGLNLISIVIISLAVYFYLPLVWNL